MKKKIWISASVCAFAAAGFLALIIGKDYWQKNEARREYEEMRQQDKVPEDSGKAQKILLQNQPVEDEAARDTVPDGESRERQSDDDTGQDSEAESGKTEKRLDKSDIPVDFDSLKEENPDIYAWITIPGTGIDYPVVQKSSDDSYYLTHTAERTESVSGAVFSEHYNSTDFDDPINVLYGHNMKDGSMFAGLHQYEDSQFMKDHDEITIYTPAAILKYRIFAAYLSDDKHILLNYNQGREEENRKAYIDEIMGQRTMKASLDTAVPVDESSSILTLSTCHSAGKDSRYLVQAYLTEKLE